MNSIVVIADDLTGANATGVQLVARGFRVETTLDDSVQPTYSDGISAKMISTASRERPSEDAYKIVFNATTQYKEAGFSLLAKRIDSTLRGNCGAEVDATLDALADDRMAIVVPAFPTAGRTVIDGVLKVPGTPFDQTDVVDLFARQSRRKVASLPRSLIHKQAFRDHLVSLHASGVRLVICDAATNQDIELIAETVWQLPFKILPVDPGVFTSTLAALTFTTAKKQGHEHQILALIGSVDPVSAEQVNKLKVERAPEVAVVATSALLDGESAAGAEITRVVSQLTESGNSYLVATSDGLDPTHRLPLADLDQKLGGAGRAAERINNAFGEIGKRILESKRTIAGLVTTGGDIARATYEHIGATGLALRGEVVPLGAFGYIKGGAYDGLAAMTKGGMVGDDRSMITCMDYLYLHTMNSSQVRV